MNLQMKPELFKNVPFSEALDIATLVEYAEGQVVSRTLSQVPTVNVTLFAFAQGEGISTHSSPGDAMVQILDGEAEVTIGGETTTVQAGQIIVMPADVPHGLEANKRFKMLLVVVKPKKD